MKNICDCSLVLVVVSLYKKFVYCYELRGRSIFNQISNKWYLDLRTLIQIDWKNEWERKSWTDGSKVNFSFRLSAFKLLV